MRITVPLLSSAIGLLREIATALLLQPASMAGAEDLIVASRLSRPVLCDWDGAMDHRFFNGRDPLCETPSFRFQVAMPSTLWCMMYFVLLFLRWFIIELQIASVYVVPAIQSHHSELQGRDIAVHRHSGGSSAVAAGGWCSCQLLRMAACFYRTKCSPHFFAEHLYWLTILKSSPKPSIEIRNEGSIS
jgi:hypothetical protein